MSDLAAHASRARAQSKALKKAEGGGGQIYVRCGVARLPICPGDTRSGKCAARPCRLQSTCAGVHGPVRASPPRPPRAVLENTNSLIRTVPYVERTADITERIRDEPRAPPVRAARYGRKQKTPARARAAAKNAVFRLRTPQRKRRTFCTVAPSPFDEELAPIIYHRESLASRAWRRLQWPTRSRRSV